MATKCVDGKVIVVTGAGRGIGREIVLLATVVGGLVLGVGVTIALAMKI